MERQNNHELNGSKHSLNFIGWQFLHECYWFDIVIPRYLNFITFSKDLLANSMLWYCPTFWWKDMYIYSGSLLQQKSVTVQKIVVIANTHYSTICIWQHAYFILYLQTMQNYIKELWDNVQDWNCKWIMLVDYSVWQCKTTHRFITMKTPTWYITNMIQSTLFITKYYHCSQAHHFHFNILKWDTLTT